MALENPMGTEMRRQRMQVPLFLVTWGQQRTYRAGAADVVPLRAALRAGEVLRQVVAEGRHTLHHNAKVNK